MQGMITAEALPRTGWTVACLSPVVSIRGRSFPPFDCKDLWCDPTGKMTADGADWRCLGHVFSVRLFLSANLLFARPCPFPPRQRADRKRGTEKPDRTSPTFHGQSLPITLRAAEFFQRVERSGQTTWLAAMAALGSLWLYSIPALVRLENHAVLR